jgi:hypothetical protein
LYDIHDYMAMHNLPSLNLNPKVWGLGTVLKHAVQCVY